MKTPDPKPESVFTSPSERCPKPENWHAPDNESTEIEVSELVYGFVRALQPAMVIETGSAWGQTAQLIGEALMQNGHGICFSYEIDPRRVDFTKKRCVDLPVIVKQESSIEALSELKMDPCVGFAWLDSTFELRIAEFLALQPFLLPGAVIGVHDTAPHHPVKPPLEEQIDALGVKALHLNTPRGVSFFQS